MSRANKVNKDHYTMAGRLTPDDSARERMRQSRAAAANDRRTKPRRGRGTPQTRKKP